MRASEIEDYYGPYGRRVEQFYIQAANATNSPGSFEDIGSHRGTLKSAIEQAETFYQVGKVRMKIVDASGEIKAYVP